MRLPIPIVGQQSVHRIFTVNSQMTVNMYPQVEADGAKTPLSLLRTPGLKLVGNAGSGVCRTPQPVFWDKTDSVYFVIGGQFVSVNNAGTINVHGALNTTSGNVSMHENQNHILVVDGTDMWTWDDSTWAQVTDADRPTNPEHVAFLDGYSIVNRGGTGDFQVSGLHNSTTWDATEVANAEANPDKLSTLIATHKDLWLFGPKIAEMWYSSSNVDFPFEPYRNGSVEWGIHAPWSLGKADESLFWLSQNRDGARMVLSARGINPTAVSTRDIEWEILNLSLTSDAEGYTYQQGGHTFYVLTFPTADRTFVFDVASKMWHRRKSFNMGRWRVKGIGFNGNKHYCGDAFNSNIHELDLDTFDENGETIECIRRSQVLHKEKRNIIVNRLELELEAGVGTATGQGENPMVMMRYSKDGGRKWSNEKWKPLGKLGDNRLGVYWTTLGQGRQWEFEFTVTDPVNFYMGGGYADITLCRA